MKKKKKSNVYAYSCNLINEFQLPETSIVLPQVQIKIWRLQYFRNRITKKEETSNNEIENPRSNTSNVTITESEKKVMFEGRGLLKQVWKLDKIVKSNETKCCSCGSASPGWKFLLLWNGSIFLLGSVLLKKYIFIFRLFHNVFRRNHS